MFGQKNVLGMEEKYAIVEKNYMNLKNLCISNLILIILNDKEESYLRKYAEIELRMRLKNSGWRFDDLLHFDDKVINQRGLDVNDYLISSNVDMQKLMESYFMYDFKLNYYSNRLLFSEKHLCNETDFKSQFFNKICLKEIKNLNNRIINSTDLNEKETLRIVKNALEDRIDRIKLERKELCKEWKNNPDDALIYSEAMQQLDGDGYSFFNFAENYNDEDTYKIFRSEFKTKIAYVMDFLNNSSFDDDLFQNLYGLNFVKKDSRRLNDHKKKLLKQVSSGFKVNYNKDGIEKALRIK